MQQVFQTVRTLIRTCGVVASIWVCAEFLPTIAGKETILSVKLSFLADVKFAVAVTLAGAAVAWALIENWLRRRKVEYMQGRIRKLETSIDPGRTSSELTPSGQTNPRDRTP